VFQLRDNILFLFPALFIFYIQKKIWSKLPNFYPSDTEIPGDNSLRVSKIYLYLFFTYSIFIFLFVEFLFSIFPIINQFLLITISYCLAYIFIITGFVFSIIALHNLGQNWTAMFLYRIKKEQQLITVGIYKYLRHPIYSAVLLELTGYQLLVNSYLSFIFLPLIYFFFLHQIHLEEKLLIKKYGQKYQNYRQKTKSILPFIF